MTLAFGETAARTLSTAINLPVADETALALIPSTAVAHLSVIQVGSAAWYYDKDSSASGSAGSVVLPSDSVGRFLIQTSTGTSVPTTRTITATTPLKIAGTTSATLAADRTISIIAATTSLAGSMSAADKTKLDSMQAGTSTLSSGTVTVSGVTLTASSRIIITMKDPGAGAITGMAGFDAPVASRNTGAGTFVVNAIDDSKSTIATAVCTFDYLIIN